MSNNKITPEQVETWKASPVTQAFLTFIRNKKTNAVLARFHATESKMGEMDLDNVIYMRGQTHICDELLSVDAEMLDNALEQTEEFRRNARNFTKDMFSEDKE